MSTPTLSHVIRRHMTVPVDQRDPAWLCDALQSAVALELATIPPYLYGLFSIKDPSCDVAVHIRKIVLQEMLHMGLACNLLTAAGGTPAVKAAARSYPTPLPGNIRHEELTVYLEGLAAAPCDDNDVVKKVFMEIEMPETPVAHAQRGDDAYPTIGLFYKAVRDAFDACSAHLPYAQQRQLEARIGDDKIFKITNLADADRAIDLIVDQGEGKPGSPETLGHRGPRDTDPADLAHYYRFKEIWRGRALRYHADSQQWEYDGDPVPRPPVHPLARVPADGWQDAPADVRAKLDACNLSYQLLLIRLEQAWQSKPGALGQAIGAMFEFAAQARDLISHQDGRTKIYGPEFRPPL
ncbi:ferritin-like domain-containing protein [Streptosporangium carneum]|uniref:Membrane protein n=1 Tax=Streptosporangium carneum TaxID=47481 RepID=A0A9W6HZG0_9ACTN|nr:ferritin-like protein [Streptosporangium carneum]GLK09212.1 membrane protein [Streptosporangium carneum]